VERNQLRRRLRELVRLKILSAMKANDIIVRVFPSAYDSSFNQLSNEIDEVVGMLQQPSAET